MKKIAFGIIIILAGVILLMSNAGIIPHETKHILISWQMVLIAIGLVNLFDRNSLISGIILIAIGSFFLAPKIFLFPFNFVHMFWPVLLIFAGVMILFKHVFFKNYSRKFQHHRMSEFKNDSGFIQETNIFSGSKHIITNPVFKGGKVTNIFGGTEIDLSQTTIEGSENVLEISCVFGGIEIKAPSDWIIKIDVTSVMGGFKDRHNFMPKTNENGKVLIIRGSVVFGGGEVKRV